MIKRTVTIMSMIFMVGIVSSQYAEEKIVIRDFSGRTVELKKNPSKVETRKCRYMPRLSNRCWANPHWAVRSTV